MGLVGYLSEYSLAEVFQEIQRDQLTGLLTIQPEKDSVQVTSQNYYLWFHSGQVVAMARNLERTSLLLMLEQRRWITTAAIQEILQHTDKLEQSLGDHLKAQGILTTEQLQVIFHAQVLQPVCSLFKLQTAYFTFNTKKRLAKAEMTGLSVSASEASLVGLRVLRDWSPLANKLPNPDSGLTKLTNVLPAYKLEMQELQVLGLADSKRSIAKIAVKLETDLDTVRQIAFRLKMVSLVQESAVIQEVVAPIAAKPEAETSIWRKQIDPEAVMTGWLKSVKGKN
jgi:Domain of unknown function (DUF4388)